MRKLVFAVALAAASMLLAGCAGTVASSPPASTPATAVSTTLKSQIDTFAGAENAIATTAAGVTIFVRSGKSTPAQRATVLALEKPIKDAVAKLRDDRDHGRPLIFDALNATIDAFQAFRANPGA